MTEIPTLHKDFSFAIIGIYLPGYSNANKYFLSNTGEHLVMRAIGNNIYHTLSIRTSADKIALSNHSKEYLAYIRWIEYYILTTI